MSHAITAELRKFFTTRMWWGMTIAMAVAGIGLPVLFALTAGIDAGNGQHTPGLDQTTTVIGVYTGGLAVGYMLTMAIGVMAIGSEYRHKTITSTFLATPRRPVVMGAKVVSQLIIGAYFAVVAMALGTGVGAAIISAKGFAPFPDSSIWRSIGLGLLVLGLWSLIGLGIGILIPNQVAALLIGIGFVFVLEPILGLVLGLWSATKDAVQYLPGQATQAALSVSSDATGAPSGLVWWQGLLVLAAYAAVMAGVGTALTVRRDVS